jgi:hypothetical protein
MAICINFILLYANQIHIKPLQFDENEVQRFTGIFGVFSQINEGAASAAPRFIHPRSNPTIRF